MDGVTVFFSALFRCNWRYYCRNWYLYSSLILLALGTLGVGAYQSFAQFYRFAASEVANDAFRSRAISWVMAGGVVAALIGPTLARFGGPLFQHLEYIGSF